MAASLGVAGIADDADDRFGRTDLLVSLAARHAAPPSDSEVGLV